MKFLPNIVATTSEHRFVDKAYDNLIYRMEFVLVIALVAFTTLLFLGKPELLPTRTLLAGGLLLVWGGLYFVAQHNMQVQALRGLVLCGVAFFLSTSSTDVLATFNVWYFLIIVYYSFALLYPYYLLIVVTVPILFGLSYQLNPQPFDWSEQLARMALMPCLGIFMIAARRMMRRTIAGRLALIEELENARDTYAKQLEERTGELKQEILERQEAERQLAKEHQLLMTIIDTFPSRLFVKDRQSRFTLVNRWSLERLGFDSPDEVVGKSDFDFYPHFAERTYAEEQDLMATGKYVIDKEETTPDRTGENRHYLISKVPMVDPESDEIIGLVGVTTNVTSLKKTQIALEKSEAAQKDFQQRLKVMNHITLELTRIKTFDELVYQSIRYGIDHLGFSRLNAWFLDTDDSDTLVGYYRVDDKGHIVASHQERMALTEEHITYQVIKGGESSIVIRDSALYDINMQQIGHGDKAFVALSDGDAVIGCLYIDTLLDDEGLTQSSIELLNLYGSTLGVLFNRQRAQEALESQEQEARTFQQQLKRLNEIMLTLSAIEQLDELCKQAVRLARDQLGFVRMGIWFIDAEDPTQRRGTWGIDKDGNLNDEHHMIFPISSTEAPMQDEGAIRVDYDEGFYDEGSDEPFGFGWLLSGVLWDGAQPIGWLFADEGDHTIPLTPNRIELFRLYTAQLGLLCAQRIAQEALRQREIRFRAITEASSDIIVIVDLQSQISYISPSLKTQMGIEPDAIIGLPAVSVIHRDDAKEALELLHDCFRQSGLHTRLTEFRVRHAEGYWVYMEAVMTSMVDIPFVQGVVISCRDLTERHIAEEQRRQAEHEQERALLLRQFISDISHDFRTPLSTIGTSAYLLKQGKPDQIEQRVEMIQYQIQRITSLIDNMNTIAKLDATTEIQKASVDVNQIIQMIANNRHHIIKDEDLELTMDLQSQLSYIQGDNTLLHDAIAHIVDNAIQFCHSGNTIVIQTYSAVDYVVVEIADTGMGIAEHDQPFIFNRLYRANKARTMSAGGGGLGLTITRRIVELHDGIIDLKSQINEGTRIKIQLPLV